ncbi:related to phospholipase D1 [Ramularia collo-cygni]|uniref:Phospholipase D1 n=1 Tax=Ramularia collo-cygni TaxID=112498 RepID=A0A2D3V6P6_9PEZI|nr:related to phospholipase D1 [Ramularia collo-cygni]CZT21110.1 related to phospholipase D1 [Ramularia collo-cygni]
MERMRDSEEVAPSGTSPDNTTRSTQPISTDGMSSGSSSNYVSSPLRAEQRNSAIEDKDLPAVPEERQSISARRKSGLLPALQFPPPSPGSFPFSAAAGASGVPPTTDELVAAQGGQRRRPQPLENSTPAERRSVQFRRNDDFVPTPSTRTATMEEGDGDANEHTPKERQNSASIFTKLRALASPASTGHVRGESNATGMSTPNAALSPQSERSEPLYMIPAEEVETGTDADEEDSGDGNGPDGVRTKKRRRRKRPIFGGSESLPTTPRGASRFSSFMREHKRESSTVGSTSQNVGPARQGTLEDISDSDNDRVGVSEDEGRDRIRSAWRRGVEGARGLSYANRKTADGEGENRRPGHLRRITGFGVHDASGSNVRQRGDRHASVSAVKWRQLRAGLRMLGQRQKNERTKVDHQKSAQLMAELLAGAPAALIFASMFQRDEHEHRKVPVLLEQLKISISETESPTDKKGDRDYIFKVDLEYGNGPARMQWSIKRSVNDFVNLHVKYKAQAATDKVRHLRSEDKSKAKIPRFPKSVIPYARGFRGLFEKVQDEEDEQEAPSTANVDGESGAGGRPQGHRRRTSFFMPPRRTSTSELGTVAADPDALDARQKTIYAERSRRKLETYLQQMIRWLIFRPDSTRLCKFLELSAMALRLSAESGYQGKQGLLQLASRRHRGEMRTRTLPSFGPHAVKERHKRRWFLVRHSYIVCVDGPESLTPHDVFLVDSDFAMEKVKEKILDQKTAQDMAKIATANATPTKKAHLILLQNAERKMKLYARNEKQFAQFRESLHHMMQNTVWSKKQRFGSFAPVRNNVWARWLVDGRDHMWQVSRAIDNAKDFIYIHDWWLSPELYMRRPAAISQKWRLDRLLQRKAQEGVKIFVIVYRNIESAIPIDSEYTKWSLLDLHENICVQRSPNQFRQNQFFWAHHEKLVVVDNMMAFVGGVDLCFGRWDDPCHSLTDDKLTGFELDQNVPRDSEHCQVWPGKDYSNPRVQDFYALDKPYEEMYDRTKVPRMPWHDIAMQIVGQPARDVGRHFVQRWNYILRSRVPTRPTPILMPPPEFDQEELDRLGMTGTCQIQILRSCAPWSIGTPNKVEHSIMNAYVAMIENSEHFVYIENQFYISSCTVEGTTIHNKIGDAIVERAIKAHNNNEHWQACLVIPLIPGFQNSVDAQDGTSVRLIMTCQYRSICRGESSIFGRLRAHGIDPEDYVRFYSLRQWGKIGPRKVLTTEQLYIHAKCMIVDDRSAIIGSANINERSMLGSRDSEVAAIVTDTCMIPSKMGGNPYYVGEFPHSLRKRLMREHLGIDVDAIYRREQAMAEKEDQDFEMQRIYRENEFEPSEEYFEMRPSTPPASTTHLNTLDTAPTGRSASAASQEGSLGRSLTPQTAMSNVSHPADLSKELKKSPERDLDVDGMGFDNMKKIVEAGGSGGRDSYVDSFGREVLLKRDAPDVERIKGLEAQEFERLRAVAREKQNPMTVQPPWPMERLDTVALGLPTRSLLPELPVLDDTDIGGPSLASETSKGGANHILNNLQRADITESCMDDPLADEFYREIWNRVAENNTKIYRQVFRCMPDSEVLDWKAYEKYNDYNERFMQSQGLGTNKFKPAKGAPEKSGPVGAGGVSPPIPNDKFLDPRAKPKNLVSGLVDKLRPASRASNVDTLRTQDTHNEKEPHRRDSPASPVSGISSDPTAVPTPENAPVDEKEAAKQEDAGNDEKLSPPDDLASRQRTIQYSETVNLAPETSSTQQTTPLQYTTSRKGRRRGNTKSSGKQMPDDVLSKEDAEELLQQIQGTLVVWPYDWLEKEERGGNWLYNIDQLAPLEIYD